MGIDASIAMGVKPVQIEDPMNALAKMMQIKDAQAASQFNAMKVDEYQRGIANQNALRQLLTGFGDDHAANQRKLLQGGFMKEAQDYGKAQADLGKTQADTVKTAAETQFKLVETAHKRIDAMGQVFGYVKDNPSAETALQATEYLVSQGIMTPEQAAQTKARIAADPSPNTIRALATQAFQSALSAKDQLPKLQTFNAGDRQVNQAVNPITGVPTQTGTTVIGQSADNKATQATAIRGQNMVDSRAREQMAQSANQHAATLAQGGKPPAGYRFTPDGNMQPIPGGPADVKASALEQQKALGASDVNSAVATLRDAYNRLEKGGGITSTEGGVLGNIAASASSSGIGQVVGRALGTDNQSARNDIAMTRPALLAALMKATGMSAKQMDSNAELKLWMATATDPTLDVESNRRALDAIERKYLPNGQPFDAGSPHASKPANGAKNSRGWTLMTDANGNKAYVSPDGKQFEEVR